MSTATVTTLRHNKVELALHHLRDGDGDGRPLLLLHGLGEHAPADVPPYATDWPGPVAALDFTGHGESSVPRGGGYTATILLGDADAALAHLGPSTVLGRGLGAFIALQLAGARASEVVGAVLCDGPGLAGGATTPTSHAFIALPRSDGPPDPYALMELSSDVRPPDYAVAFVHLARAGSPVDRPITVASRFRPPWLEAVADEPGVAKDTVSDALGRYAAAS